MIEKLILYAIAGIAYVLIAPVFYAVLLFNHQFIED